MLSKNKFIFLDVDGVLNSSNYYDRKCKFSIYKKLLNDYSEKIAFDASEFDPIAVERLNDLIKRTDAKIVLSSSWRHNSYIEDIFKAVGIIAPIFSTTPYLGTKRGYEIKAWIDEQPKPYAYVIIDDELDMLEEQYPCFIHTDWKTGLTKDNVEQAIKILNNYD